jgi:hypothetical protein
VGQFRTIQIIHRDPTEVKELIEAQLADLIDTGESKSSPQQNNEAQQMMKMMQQLTGNRKSGGVDTEQEKPKVKLGVDTTTNQLLVTGPEFIYKEVLKMVIELDREELSDAPTMQMFKRPGDTEVIKSTLTAMFGDKIEIVIKGEDEDTQTGQGAGGRPQPSSSGSSEAAQKMQAQQEAARAAFMNAIRAQQSRGQQSGGRSGAPSSRGGSSRGGSRGGGRGR